MTLKDHSFDELYDKHGDRWLRAMEQADREVREQDPSDPIKHADPACWYLGEGEWAVFNDGGGVVGGRAAPCGASTGAAIGSLGRQPLSRQRTYWP